MSNGNRVTSSAERDKRQHIIGSLAEEEEKAAKTGSSKIIYQITKIIAGNMKPKGGSINDKDGTMHTTNVEQKNRWTERFPGRAEQALFRYDVSLWKGVK